MALLADMIHQSEITNTLHYTVENHCHARFHHEKQRLYADARNLLDSLRYDAWLMDVYTLNSPHNLIHWLLTSEGLADSKSAEFLVKYLLILGFHASHAPDLRFYALEQIDALEADEEQDVSTLSARSLYQPVAHNGYFM